MLRVSTLSSYLSQDLEAAACAALECGLDGLDLDRVWEHPIERLAEASYGKPLQYVIGRVGIKVFCLATNIFHCWLDSEAAFRAHLHSLEASLRLAETLKCPVVRCYAFLRDGTLEDSWPCLVERFQQAAELAAQYGLTLGIQNDADTFLGTGREVARLLDAVGSSHLEAVWDPGASVFDMDQLEIPYPDGYRQLQGRIAHVMLRDIDTHKHRGLLCEVEFGEGIIDYRRQLPALVADGYAGAVSLASIWRAGMAWNRDLDEGDFTEAGGQQATCISLANLRAIMDPDPARLPINADAYVPKGKIRHE